MLPPGRSTRLGRARLSHPRAAQRPGPRLGWPGGQRAGHQARGARTPGGASVPGVDESVWPPPRGSRGGPTPPRGEATRTVPEGYPTPACYRQALTPACPTDWHSIEPAQQGAGLLGWPCRQRLPRGRQPLAGTPADASPVWPTGIGPTS